MADDKEAEEKAAQALKEKEARDAAFHEQQQVVHVPPSQQSAQGPVAKPGEPLRTETTKAEPKAKSPFEPEEEHKSKSGKK